MAPNHYSPRPAGFTLIEVLIALLVLSIGLLGMATLQTKGQQFNAAAYFHTQATYIATDLMDRMRNNISAARAGDYAVETAEPPDCPNKNLGNKCSGEYCSAADLAQYDLYNWCMLLESLPGGEAAVIFTPSPGPSKPTQYMINVKWWGINRADKNADKKVEKWLLIP